VNGSRSENPLLEVEGSVDMAENAAIPQEVIDRLRAATDPGVWKAALRQYPAPSWLDLMAQDKLPVDARKSLATACEGEAEYLHVVMRLADQTSLGEAIARQIVAEPNWSRLQRENDRAGLSHAHTKEQLATSLSKLVVNRDLLFLFLGILFSRSSLAAIAGLFVDNDKAVRLEAARVLGTFNIAETEQALVAALDDTDEKVREQALQILKAQLPEERLVGILRAARERAESMQSAVKTAKDTLFSLPSNIPGISTIVGAMNTAFSAATTAAGGVAGVAGQAASTIGSAASSVASKVSSRWSELFPGAAATADEEQDALFALLVAMAWADGTISADEQRKLESLVEAGGIPSSLWQYVHQPAELPPLVPYLEKLKAPAQAVKAFADIVDHAVTPQAAEWLRQLAAILKVPESSFSGK
jgi:uncharacterized membrane protein YebE (DUF533 family)